MRRIVRMSAVVMVSVLLATSVVLAAEPASRPDAGFKRVGPQTVTGGPTVDEYFARQADLHAWLMRETPAGSLANPISVRLTEAELEEINSIQPAGSGPLRVGTVKQIVEPVRLDCNAVGARGQRVLCSGDGVLQMTPGGGFVWARAVTSPGAVGIRVHVTDFHLPDDADLFFYSLDGEAYGPFQRFGPNDDGDFWLPSVMSDTGVLVVRHFGPRGALEISDVSMTFTEIGHIGEAFNAGANEAVSRAPGDLCPYNNQNCVLNASCENTGPALPAQNAVAKMLWVAGCCINVCTGGLIGDTAGSQTPYFLTANHCLSGNNAAGNLEAFFQYTMGCGAECPAGTFDPAPVTTKTMGATVKATNKKGDFTLLELSQTPPSGSVLLGWDNTPIASSGGAALHRIHHPEGAPQAYTEHSVDANIGTCLNTPRGQFIYSTDVHGATEQGSSGSPVVNANGDIVGQLTGCCPVGGGNCNDVCDPDNHTIDGALAFYFPNVEQFLDPSPCTPTTADCEDGADNDCDGLTDCNDTNGGAEDCSAFPACQSGCVNPGGFPPGNTCTSDSQCCSNKCKGPPGNKTCR